MTAVFVLHRADGAPSSTAFRKQAFGASDPFASHREIAGRPRRDGRGRIVFVGELDVASFPHIETLAVIQGELTLEAAGAAPLVVGPGQTPSSAPARTAHRRNRRCC